MKNPKYSFNNKSKKDFEIFLKSLNGYSVIDLFETTAKDSIAVVDPAIYFLSSEKKAPVLNEKYLQLLNGKESFQLGSWIVIPAFKEVYHLISQDELLELRTIRNRDLITTGEQHTLYSKKIMVVGLSVGSNILANLVRFGIGNRFTIIDYDKVESHNLNRTQFTLRDVGTTKIQTIAKLVLGIDPYLRLNLIEDELKEKYLDQLIPQQDLIVDAFDHFESKIALRNKAKEYKKPVVSGWDVGSGTVIIVERYDLEADLQLNLFLNNVELSDVLAPTSSLREKIDIFIKIIGKETHDERMLSSVHTIGTILTGIPQHIISTSLTSAVFCQVIGDIFLEKTTASFRNHIDLQKLIYS